MVYFAQEQRSELIWVGSSSDGKKRLKSHRSYGFEPIAVIQGSPADEDAVQDYFKADLVPNGGDSRFGGERIYRYITWLLERNYAAPTIDDAAKLPRLPFSVWEPREERWDEAYDGQLTLISEIPAKDRPRYIHDLVHLSSESDEWYTPNDIIEAARRAMGSIDTDPASEYEAQRTFIKAAVWYSKSQDGLRTDHPWSGNVWLNPPYGRGEGSATSFVERLISEFAAGNVSQAITCLNVASTTANWFAPVWKHAASHCVYSGRPNYWRPGVDASDSSPSKGSIISYFGASEREFAREFCTMGQIIKVAS